MKGGNYGWNVREGTHCFDTSAPSEQSQGCPDATADAVRGGESLRDPIIEYPHSRDGEPIGVSVIGGYLYDGAIDTLDGKYVFGDYIGDGTGGTLFAATPAEEGLWSFEELQIEGVSGPGVGGSLLAIGRDDEGELYALTTDSERDGAVHKLVSAPGASASEGATTTNATETSATTTSAATETSGGTTRAATPVPSPTTTSTASESGRAQTATAGTRPTQTELTGSASGGTTGAGGETTGTEGPGFGVLAALAGCGALVARLLGRED